jgi:hypothetical protein
MKTILILILALVPIASYADELPEHIAPSKPKPAHIVNAEFRLETAALAGAWIADTITTHNNFANIPGSTETGLFFNGSRGGGTAKIMGAWAAVDVAAVVASYEWKKRVHNKYLHPLWRVPLIVGTIGHATSAMNNPNTRYLYPAAPPAEQ